MNSKIRLISIMAASFMPIYATVSAGGEVNNGGGAAEHNFFVSYLNLEGFILNCTASSSCKISGRQRDLLKNISSSMNAERRVADQIRFLSGRSTKPNFFDDHGAVRVAKTGSEIGSPIYLNLDMIYPVDPNGHTRAMTVPEAIAILVHEFGHHHGVLDHQELDLLGAKVSALSAEDVKQIWLYNNKLSLTSINRNIPLLRQGQTFPDFFVAGLPSLIIGGHEIVNGNLPEKYVDVSEELKSKLTCPLPNLDLVGFHLSNLKWKRGKFRSFGDIQVLARACVLRRCEGSNDSTTSRDKNSTVEIDLNFYYPPQPEDGYMGMTYRPGSMKITAVNDWEPCPSDDYTAM